jgi:hypothetical protein
MSQGRVEPIQKWSAAKLGQRLHEILRGTAPEKFESLVPVLQKTLAAARSQQERAELELQALSVTGDLDPDQLAALKEMFSVPHLAAVEAARNKVFLAERALEYVTKRLACRNDQ